MYNYSDRGEFSNNGFINQLTLLSDQLQLKLFWEFGAANHNKDFCDGEGHVMKTGMDQATTSKKLQYNAKEEYVITAANFCTKHYSSPSSTHTREFIPVTDQIKHMTCAQVRYYLVINVFLYFKLNPTKRQ